MPLTINFIILLFVCSRYVFDEHQWKVDVVYKYTLLSLVIFAASEVLFHLRIRKKSIISSKTIITAAQYLGVRERNKIRKKNSYICVKNHKSNLAKRKIPLTINFIIFLFVGLRYVSIEHQSKLDVAILY